MRRWGRSSARRPGPAARRRGASTRWGAPSKARAATIAPLLAYPLTGMGEVLLLRGRTQEARKLLERALALRTRSADDPAERARTEFALARALHACGRDGRRALALAARARDTLGRLGQTR